MARIPTLYSDPARNVMPGSGSPQYAGADAFGAGIGEAQMRGADAVGTSVQKLSTATIGLGVSVGDYAQGADELAKKSATANSVANFDFTSTYLDLQKQPPPDGLTYTEAVANAYDDKVTKHLDTISDDSVRSRVKMQLMAQKPQYVNSAAGFQKSQGVIADKAEADSGFNLQANRVRADPQIDTYNDALAKTNAIIDARPNLTPVDKDVMKKKNAEMLALRRFEGLIQTSSTDPEALGAIENELTAPNSVWKGRMSDEAYDRTLDKITTLKKAANSQETSSARAALQSVTQRNTDGVKIDPAELAAVQDVVSKSKNPALLSQFAMINRSQQIYRDHEGLPLEQQRQKIEEFRKKGGIETLPQPVKDGINKGAQLTGGQISQEYLAGLVGFEYGGLMASGDYGQGTAARVNGKPASDAVGVAQFTTPTFRATVRAHPELGVDPNATDAQLDEMRKDPGIAIPAAALHGLDNKKVLEAAFNRPVNDADLYFAHLLGVAGATKFLSAATQTPNAPATGSVAPEQVEANRGIFYDETGRARTNAQVRSYIANATMNAPSRVDYAGVKAATLVYNNTVKGLKDDPITFASTVGRFGDVGNVSSPEGMQRRGVVAQQVAEYYNIPSSDLKPFTHSEAEGLAKKARDGTAEETLQVMQQIQGLGTPDVVRAANKQIGEKDTLFGYAASLAYNLPDRAGVASDIIRGEKKMKEDKDVLATIGQTETEMQASFSDIVGKSLAATKLGTDTRKAATAHYIERQISRGGARPGHFDKSLFGESVQAVLGAGPGEKAIDNVNGSPTLMPRGVDRDVFNSALSRMVDNDYIANSKWGGPPRYASGNVVSADEIAREGKFEAVGGGEYRIKMGDGKYALSAAYKDGSADFYIFRADPERLKNAAQRQRVLVQPNLPAGP